LNKIYLTSLLLIIVIILVVSSCSDWMTQRSLATPTLASNPTPYVEPHEGGELPTIVPTNPVKIPVTSASLNLRGKLIYNLGAVDQGNNYIVQIQSLDLLTGNMRVLYKAIKDAYAYYISISPNGKDIVMAYSPPPQSDPHIVEALYVMPLDGSHAPQLLFMPAHREDEYLQAEWSPDGKYICYTYVNFTVPSAPNWLFPLYKIFRMEYPNGQPELIAEEAYWPRLSPDGEHLVYVFLDPSSGEYKLKTADPNGQNVHEVIMSGSNIPHEKTAPFFSPDGKSIIFRGNVAGESYQPNWFGKIMGIRAAKADGELSDWFSVPVSGGKVKQLTHVHASYLYGNLSPDKRRIISYGGDALFVMNLDGSELTVLMSGLHGFHGTVIWMP
jgi:Tol biopolymer transport system component